jgi:hypothetical protein
MAGQHRPSESLESIAGGALVGLGLHILSGSLDRAAAQWRHLLGTTTGEVIGVLPSVLLAASHAVQAYASDHHTFLQGILRILFSFWPLLLVIAGTLLLRNSFADNVKASPEAGPYLQRNRFKNDPFETRDTGCRFRCPSFDA